MKVYEEGSNVAVDRGGPYAIVYIPRSDCRLLEYTGAVSIGIFDEVSRATYLSDWDDIEDKNGDPYGVTKEEVIQALSEFIGTGGPIVKKYVLPTGLVQDGNGVIDIPLAGTDIEGAVLSDISFQMYEDNNAIDESYIEYIEAGGIVTNIQIKAATDLGEISGYIQTIN